MLPSFTDLIAPNHSRQLGVSLMGVRGDPTGLCLRSTEWPILT